MADFIGDANILPVTVLSVSGDAATVEIGAVRLTLPARGLGAGPALAAIRPHAFGFVAVETANALPATLVFAAYLASRTEFVIDTAFARCSAQRRTGIRFRRQGRRRRF